MINAVSTAQAIEKCLAIIRITANTLLMFAVIAIFAANGQTVEASQTAAVEFEKSANESGNQWSSESLKIGINLYQQSSAEWNKIKNFKKASVTLQEAGRLLLILGENESALKNFQEAYKIAETHQLDAESSKIHSLISLAFQKTGDLNKSQKHLDDASRFMRSSGDKSAQAWYFYASAEQLYLQHQYREAVKSYKQSLNLWSELGEWRRYGETCIYIAYTFFADGDLSEGLNYASEAERTLSEIGNRRGVALSQIATGHILSSLNLKQKALEYYAKANENIPADLDLLEKGALLNGFGAIYEYYGDFEASLKFRIEAFEAFKRDNYLDGQMATMHSVIGLSFRLNKLEQAAFFIKESERLSKVLNDKYYITLVYRVIGDNFFDRNQNEEAVNFYHRSLANTTGIGSRTNYILIHHKLGRIYLRTSQNDLAEKHFNLSLSESIRLKNHFIQAENYYYLAQLERTLNQPEKSLLSAKKSVEITDLLSSDVLSSKLKQKYFSSIYDRYELLTNLLINSRNQVNEVDFSIQALQTSEKSRARSMLENLAFSEASFTKDADGETVSREKEILFLLNAKADKLTDLLSKNGDKPETEKLDVEINELEHELENIKANLKQNSPVYSAIKNPAPFDVAEFQRDVLDDNSLLLEFSFGKEESYLWVIGKTEVNSYILPPREQIESRIEKLRQLIDSREMLEGETVENYQARVSESEAVYKSEAKQLSNELFGQVADKFSNKRLLIVPDGKLHYFPVAALPFPNSTDNQPILLTNEVVYEPSAATLTLLMRNGLRTSDATKNLLVFSDPIFSNQDARVANTENANEIKPDNSLKVEKFRFAESLTSLVRLNASKDEADSIVEIVGAADSTTLSGAAATRERALDASIADYRIVHFATHGLIKEDRPELSGIVLSQVDEGGQSLNGVVRLQDIYAMNLSADAVVLSACSTGIGKEVKGEGLMSLNNAFLQTGAKSVVSSLWKVDDYAAQELMKNFYHELSSGTATTSEALRRAQIKMRQNPQYQSPFYWAAFTIQGDFKTIPQLAKPFDYRIFGLLICPIAVLGLYAYRRRRLNYSTVKL